MQMDDLVLIMDYFTAGSNLFVAEFSRVDVKNNMRFYFYRSFSNAKHFPESILL